MSGGTWGNSWGACWGDTWGSGDAIFAGARAARSDAMHRRLRDDDEMLLLIFAQAIAAALP